MIDLDVQQGSEAWHTARAKCLNASEAPAMMGVHKQCTRTELLRMKKTGITPDVSDWVQRFLFDKGHDVEEAVRPMIEQIIGEELYPVVATDDSGKYLASSDGATLLCNVGMECKLWNEETAEAVRAGQVPDYHAWQLDQQIAVFGFEKIIFVVSDGTPERFVWCEYRTTPERIARLMAGWAQFERDLAEYVPQHAETDKPIGHAPETLPALRIEVTGMVTASNLDAFREHALSVLGSIKTDLQTDADFADAEKTVKWAQEVESKLDAAKEHALSQTTSIDKLFKTIDEIKGEARAVRLKLDKLVKTEKESRKVQITQQAHQALVNHVAQLHQRLGGHYLPTHLYAPQIFGESIRGLKSLDSMRDKVGTALANAKIECNAMADRIDANRKAVEDMSLVPDFAQICTKAPDDFAALVLVRINQRKEAEERRLEAERQRIRAEEQEKVQRESLEAARQQIRHAEEALRIEADRKAQAVAQQMRALDQAEDAAIVATQPAEQPAVESTPAPAESEAKVTLGQINAVIAPVQISAAGLAQLGIQSVGRDRSAVLYRESDVPRICAALIRHLSALPAQHKEVA